MGLDLEISQKTKGLVAATFTPFDAFQRIDIPAIQGYADWLNQGGISGAFVNGSTGEGPSLTVAERKQVAEAWMAANTGDLRIFVHVGHTSLPVAQELAAHAEKIGADAVACIAPYFFRPRNISELADWCAEVAGAAPELPFYYYHIPSISGVNLKMAELLPVVQERIPNFAGMKFTYEDLEDYKACLDYEKGRYDILFGRDEILLESLKLGGAGAVGTTYNFTAPIYSRMISALENGDQRAAMRFQEQATRLIEVCVNGEWHPVAAFKWLLSRLGLNCGGTRLPIPEITEDQIQILEKRLEKFFQPDILQQDCPE